MDIFEVFLALTVAHFVCDYALQSRVLELSKDRHRRRGGLWLHAISAHSAVNAVGVTLATLNPVLGMCEFVAHWMIDYNRLESKYSFHVDQLLHLLTKVVWASAVYFLR